MRSGIGRPLLRWFRASGRPLPWRGPFPRDPYRVLVSEVMLQQTQVERVLTSYGEFLHRFPTLQVLGAAQLDEVLEAWSGLGYYRRARLLHAASRAVLEIGGWPCEVAALRRLPGIGDYTAAAVSAFAFGGAEPPVDGNVSRVACRVRGLRLALGSRAILTAGSRLGRQAYRESGTPEVFEALMELGARVCTPAAPRCADCPLRPVCAAHANGVPEAVPLPQRSRRAEAHRWAALWVRDERGRVLLQRVAEGGPLAGLWLPPFRPVAGRREGPRTARNIAAALGLSAPRQAGRVRHSITHRRIEVAVYLCRAYPGVRESDETLTWVDPDRPGVATSSLFGKIRAAANAATRLPAAGRGEEDTQ
ncbi:MAG: A/G-specific adenine glycosylase [Acidobacteriota bacterium]